MPSWAPRVVLGYVRTPHVWPAALAAVIAVAFTIFQLLTSYGGTLATLQQVYTHLGFALVLVLLTQPGIGEGSRLFRYRWYINIPLILAGVVVSAYPVVNFMEIAHRGAGNPTTVAVVLGVLATVLVLEGTRRVVGWPLPILAAIFIAYAFVGPYLPGLVAHRGFDVERVAATLYLTTNGIAGTPLQVSATYVAVFVIFAAFLDVSGAGKFFIDWTYAALGWFRGGPAKVAVVASALMGTVSGSAVANTAATGTFTIPIMKRAGLKPAFAGAVEAAASSGGQIMPPVMGAAAFIMVEITGLPYTDIMVAATIPAFIYFLGIFAMVDFQVAKQGIRGVPRSELPDAWKIFKGGCHLLVPLIVLVYLLVIVRYTPTKAAVIAIGAVVAVTFVRRSTWMGPRRLFEACRRGGHAMLEVAMACACAGLIIGVLLLTGLALRLSSIMIDLSGGNLMALLILTMVISLILGMGLPTSAVYIVLATLVAPALAQMGVDPLAAHMFVFYFGVLANVTPPVAIAAYVGAGLAGANSTLTGLIAFRLALAGFILPFVWVYNPALLLQGDGMDILLAVATAVIGVLSLASAVQGYLFGSAATWYQRIVLGTGALTLIKPGLVTDTIGLGLIGLAVLIRFWIGTPVAAMATHPGNRE